MADALVSLLLPHLRNFRGPVGVVPLISGARDLQEARLSWGYDERSGQDVEQIIRALKSMTRDTPFICSNDECNGIFIELLDSISRKLPQKKTLQLSAYSTSSPPEAKITQLRNCRPRFAGLLYLSVITDSDDRWFNVSL
ncbi:hypothetical protein B0H19DRAFT_1250426 [Mycena capillaripes]|nr:hypothetical protein B0H19DRAFT_1250426 [Mycena capillaripes]